jgi:uncharacterized protein (DUF1330 family)
MTVQLIQLATRRPDSDADFKAYASVAGPMLVAVGGVWNSDYNRVADLAGEGFAQIRVMDFPDAECIETVFASPEYQELIPFRDKAFDDLRIIIAGSAT